MEIVSIAVSKAKGIPKKSVQSVELIQNYGIAGDAHAGPWHRQVSFLAAESIDNARSRGMAVSFGDFAENIATIGINWHTVAVGTKLRLGHMAEVEITQIGKECHTKCAIFHKVGDCIMPREGIFAKVLKSGPVQTGDPIEFIRQ